MPKKKPEGICNLCGQFKKLSKEHIPPKNAFNNHTILLKKIDKLKTKSELRWRSIQKQGGNFEYALCEDCNNRTGAWYGKAYIEFVKTLANIKAQENRTIPITLRNAYPLRIVKQALTSICAGCGPKFCQKHPILKTLILNKEYRSYPDLIKVYCYLLATIGGRNTGVSGIADLTDHPSPSKFKIVAEFSWWPVGWILSFNDQKIEGAFEVTHFFNFSYDEKTSLFLNLPCHPIATAYPLDFRNSDQVKEDIEKQEKKNK